MELILVVFDVVLVSILVYIFIRTTRQKRELRRDLVATDDLVNALFDANEAFREECGKFKRTNDHLVNRNRMLRAQANDQAGYTASVERANEALAITIVNLENAVELLNSEYENLQIQHAKTVLGATVIDRGE